MMDLWSRIEFREPLMLVAMLLAIPVYLLARRAPGRVLFSSFMTLPRAGKSWRASFSWVPDALIALATVALVVALAGPRIGERHGREEREGIAIMMVVDRSGSMRALDLSTDDEERTRLDAVKAVFEEFVLGGDGLPGRPDDAVGLVAFAGYADTGCPLTLDHDALVGVARTIEIVEDRSEDGTAIGDGLGLAVERLRNSTAHSRVAVLLTDGVNNAGTESPLSAADLAKSQGVKVYTIGAGTTGLAPVRVRDPFSGRSVLRPVPVEIDEESLREIARRTGGQYFRATDADGLREVYREIDRLERTRISEERWREYDEHFGWFVAAGLSLACLAWVSRGAVFPRLP
jgi:Ca-activated chloride channel family protein